MAELFSKHSIIGKKLQVVAKQFKNNTGSCIKANQTKFIEFQTLAVPNLSMSRMFIFSPNVDNALHSSFADNPDEECILFQVFC